MRIVLNGQEGRIEVKGGVVSYTPSGEALHNEASERFAAGEVTQLLRSRKNRAVAKMTTEAGKTYVAQFGSLADREAFIDSLVEAQAANRGDDMATAATGSSAHETTEQWVSRAICQSAVDVGALSRTELQDILNEENHRGVVHAFDALEALVDRSTFRLRPLTESMENDVLRQIPILAVIFERHVMDEETKRSFWEAVIRKYFCFSYTFLEEELERMGEEAAAAPNSTAPAVPPSQERPDLGDGSGDKGGRGLSVINGASWQALPKLTGVSAALAAVKAVDEEQSEEARAAQESEAVENGEETAGQSRFVSYFRPKRALCSLTLDPTLSVPPVRRSRKEKVASPPPSLFVGHRVAHALPAEPTHKDVLETLRRFWRSNDVKQREAALLQLERTTNNKKRPGSFIEEVCLQQAKSYVQVEGDMHRGTPFV